ncbi:MAG: hypothetical protein A7316_01650, partial [Candidatus Altiarchaeales archaeon WOR_SM1_86-2]
VLVGVSDKGEIVGATDRMEEQVANIAHSLDMPIYPEIEKVRIDRKLILVVKVKKDSKLHIYKGYGRIRVGSTNKPMTVEELIKRGYELGIIKFDSQVCMDADLKDIDESKVRWFLKKAKRERRLNIDPDTPTEEALYKLDLLEDGKLTNTAVLMFGKEPPRFFLQGEVRCAKFKGTRAVKPFIDMRVVHGTGYEQIDDAEKFVLNNIRKAAWTVPGQVEREEKWEYPPDAIREAIANAVAHRDYCSTANVHVSIFDDRIEVWNPGKLPEPLTPEDLKKEHKSIPVNPLLAKTLFLIKYIEKWGTGTNDIVRYCVESGLPEPIFKEESGGLSVIITKSKLTEEFLEGLDLNERQRKAIDHLKEHKRITSSEYAELFGITKRTARNDLRGLVDERILAQMGTTKKTTYYKLIV